MRKEVIQQMANLVTTAFGLVAALAWNGAIQSWFESQETLRAGGPWVYAILVTVIAVAATVFIGRAAARVAGEEEEEAGGPGA
jgi:TRAP-type C4-dicarboxylate transport system permease small subunit